MYKLYYSPGACSLAVHALLIELGVEFEAINTAISEGKTREPEYLKLNPRGQIPVLIDDGIVRREGASIMLYLAEKHKSPLLPTDIKEKAEAIEWLCFANSTLHPVYSRAFWIMRNIKDEKTFNETMDITIKQVNNLWKEIEERLETRKYICGDKPTLADYLITIIANWRSKFPVSITMGERTRALFLNITSRPAYKQAIEAEGIEYRAAA